jgi:hypothetical protein
LACYIAPWSIPENAVPLISNSGCAIGGIRVGAGGGACVGAGALVQVLVRAVAAVGRSNHHCHHHS